jgi:hypothetical protein
MKSKAELLAWAKNILAKGTTAPPHELLQLRPGADANAASDAFMKLARVAHPDLHRNSLTETEFDQLVLAYSRVAGAYQELRSARNRPNTTQPPFGATPPPPSTPSNAAVPPAGPSSMNSKALVYFRKAELALNQGELRNAILQLKMAIAADPQASILKKALAEVEAELAKLKSQ